MLFALPDRMAFFCRIRDVPVAAGRSRCRWDSVSCGPAEARREGTFQGLTRSSGVSEGLSHQAGGEPVLPTPRPTSRPLPSLCWLPSCDRTASGPCVTDGNQRCPLSFWARQAPPPAPWPHPLEKTASRDCEPCPRPNPPSDTPERQAMREFGAATPRSSQEPRSEFSHPWWSGPGGLDLVTGMPWGAGPST